MKITQDLADKYARYRERYLSGSGGSYQGLKNLDANLAGQRYRRNVAAPFTIVTDAPGADKGTFLHCDMAVDTNVSAAPEEWERAPISDLAFGDNTLFSAIALVNFVAEYSVVGLPESLEIALGFAKSFQRLSSHHRGFGETGSPPYGFCLRADTADWDDKNENFTTYNDGDSATAHQLAPSLDQYAGLLCGMCFAYEILKSAPHDEAHAATRQALISVLEERTRTVARFIAFKTLYAIRWEAGGEIQRPKDDRGPYCLAAAYPFARIAGRVLEGDAGEFGQYHGDLVFALIRDLPNILINAACDKLKGGLEGLLKDDLEKKVKNIIGDIAWDAINKLMDARARVDQAFQEYVLQPITERLIEPVLQALKEWNGVPGTEAMNLFLSQAIFDLFATGTLLDTSDQPFEDSVIDMSIEQILEMVGHVDIPDSIPIDLSFEFAPSKPSWWIWNWDAPKWPVHIASFEIPLGSILSLSIPIPMSRFLRQTIALASTDHVYMQFMVYNMISAAELFDSLPDFDAIALANRYDNAWYMAIAHRFHGAPLTDSRVAGVLQMLETAPDGFPKSHGVGDWNQDFRWNREQQGKNEDTKRIYSGLDLMAPLMLAASHEADRAANREALLNALSRNNNEGEDVMGPFRLPFQGPITSKQIVELTPGAVGSRQTAYIGVVFDRAIGSAKVNLMIPQLNGGQIECEFSQEDGCSKLIAIPMTSKGIVIKTATPNARGVVVFSAEGSEVL